MSSEKSSSVIGFVLIGVILLLFSWYNTKQYEKQVESNRKFQDSLAMVEAAEAFGAIDETSGTDSLQTGPAPLYQNALINEASGSSEEFVTIENGKLALTVSTRGAQPYSVLIKDYFCYDIPHKPF